MQIEFEKAKAEQLRARARVLTPHLWMPIADVGAEEKYDGFFLLFATSLIHEDFNPSGIVEGYWQDGEGWIAAIWNNDQDCWNAKVIEPTHAMRLPLGPQA